MKSRTKQKDTAASCPIFSLILLLLYMFLSSNFIISVMPIVMRAKKMQLTFSTMAQRVYMGNR
jgi:hypothetical protein